MGINPEERRAQVLSCLNDFLSTPIDTIVGEHVGAKAEENAVALFQSVATSVPAYKAFLQEHEIDPAAVKTFAEFRRLPPVTKENYINRHSLPDLCRDGLLEGCDMIAVSSGSTDKATFWPRFAADEYRIAARFEQVFHDNFSADQQRTLAVVCFPLGTWVGGMFTTTCCRLLACKGYPIIVVTPGNNREEIFRVVQELGPHFEQVVLLGYPPFLKDVVDSGIARGVEWPRYHIRMVFAGEVFSEEWRSLVSERVGATNHCYDSASLYGTADAGVLGNETPLSISIRRFLAERPDAARQLFGESRLPTLVQYDPISRFFETDDGTLLFSGDGGIPLVRYNILDTGGLIGYEAMLRFLMEWGFNPLTELRGQNKRGIHRLPFVYVFGRSNFAVSYFGANVYPENVTVGLEQPGIREWVTGKFVMEATEDADRNRWLSVVVELASNMKATEERRQAVANSIRTHLLRLNGEFANYVLPEYQTPRVTLKPTGDPEYFPVGIKHRYTRS